MPRKITIESMREGLEAAVAARGEDYVYPQDRTDDGYWVDNGYADQYDDPKDAYACVYWNKNIDAPACIVGYALDYLGYDVKNMPQRAMASSAMNYLVGGVDFTAADVINVRYGADCAQEMQDNGGTWGDALNEYNQFIETYEEKK